MSSESIHTRGSVRLLWPTIMEYSFLPQLSISRVAAVAGPALCKSLTPLPSQPSLTKNGAASLFIELCVSVYNYVFALETAELGQS